MIFRLPYYRGPTFETAFTVYCSSKNTSKFRLIRGSFLEVDLIHGEGVLVILGPGLGSLDPVENWQ